MCLELEGEDAVNRCFANIVTSNVPAVASFYETLLGMERHADFGWFVILTHAGMPGLELGVLDRESELTPEAARGAPGGVMLTFVVEDVDAVAAQASALGADILEPPTDMPYGQRRMLLRDPAGTVLDVSSPKAAPPT
ncbi:MAG: VOC family protein [Pseudomonadota bacterium]